MTGICLWVPGGALETKKANLAQDGTASPLYLTALRCWVMLMCLETAGTRTDGPGHGRGEGGGAGWAQSARAVRVKVLLLQWPEQDTYIPRRLALWPVRAQQVREPP